MCHVIFAEVVPCLTDEKETKTWLFAFQILWINFNIVTASSLYSHYSSVSQGLITQHRLHVNGNTTSIVALTHLVEASQWQTCFCNFGRPGPCISTENISADMKSFMDCHRKKQAWTSQIPCAQQSPSGLLVNKTINDTCLSLHEIILVCLS